MFESKEWVNFITASLFILAGSWSIGAAYQMKKYKELSIASTGIQTRKLLYIILSIASITRCVCVLCDTAVIILDTNILDGWKEWTHALMQILPDLVFQIAFSILILFWAQLYYRSIRITRPRLKTAFFIFNFTICVVYLSLVAFTAINKTYDELASGGFYLTFVIYLFGFIVILFYGIQVIIQLQPRRFETYSDNRNSVLFRVLGLTILLSFIFAFRIGYSFLVISGIVHNIDGYPIDGNNQFLLNRYYFDLIFFGICEWIPTVIILITMRRRRPNISQNEHEERETDVSKPLLGEEKLSNVLVGQSHTISPSQR